MSRREFCALGAMAAATTLVPSSVMAAGSNLASDKRLAFVHTHTGERLASTYCCDGVNQPDALAAINHLLRDFRTNEVRPIDVRLLDLLYMLNGEIQTADPYHVISGYRSPNTNRMLRARGGSHTGVATRSLHMVGKAIDIRLPGVRLEQLRGAARSLQLGGVGYYPSSNFVHVDTGRVRAW